MHNNHIAVLEYNIFYYSASKKVMKQIIVYIKSEKCPDFLCLVLFLLQTSLIILKMYLA